MNNTLYPAKVQTGIWFLFLAYYFAAKYFVGGFTGFSWNYLLSVIVLVALTAAAPYYIARFAVRNSRKAMSWVFALALPTALTAGGLTLFFFGFIKPNFETIELANIIHRAVMPGVAISVLMLLQLLWGTPEVEEDPEAGAQAS